MENLPDVVKRKIFALLSKQKNKKDWRSGAFFPNGRYFRQKSTVDQDKLKFCLIYPDYVWKLNINLATVRILTYF